MSTQEKRRSLVPPRGDGRVAPAFSASSAKRLENRRAPRRVSAGQGEIRVPGFRLSLPCRIVDMSATGARLDLRGTSAHNLPVRVTVVFAGERTEVDAMIKWRSDQQCGVHFVSPFRKLGTTSEKV